MMAIALASCTQPVASTPTATPTSTPTSTPASTPTSTPSPCAAPGASSASQAGSISGQLSSEGQGILPMTLYAIPVTAVDAGSVRGQAACFQTVQTVNNQTTYHMLDLAPGNYYVFATRTPAVEWFPASE